MTSDFILTLRLVLAAVLIIASVTKIADRRGSTRTIIGFGVPPSIAPLSALLLPVTEISIATMLLVNVLVLWGALAGFVLLSLFTALIGNNLLKGRKVNCNCFGKTQHRPADWTALLRNGGLIVIAAIIVLHELKDSSLEDTNSYAGFLITSYLPEYEPIPATIGLLSVVFWLVGIAHNKKKHNNERAGASWPGFNKDAKPAEKNNEQKKPLVRGIAAPNFELVSTDTTIQSLKNLLIDGKPILLVFVDPECGNCNKLMPSLAEWQRRYAFRINIIPISSGSLEVNRARELEYNLKNVLIQKEKEVSKAYSISSVPSGVLIEPDGKILHFASGTDEISRLMMIEPSESREASTISRQHFLRMILWSIPLILFASSLSKINILGSVFAQPPAAKSNSNRVQSGLSGGKYDHNTVRGDCQYLEHYIENTGLRFPKGAFAKDRIGQTLASYEINRQYSSLDYSEKAILDCQDPACKNCGKVYASLTECQTDGPSGLGCFGHHNCQTIVCAKATDLSFKVKPNTIVVIMRWIPEGSVCKDSAGNVCSKCLEERDRWERDTEIHENFHVLDVAFLAKEAEDKLNRYDLTGCGKSKQEAEQDLDDKIDAAVRDTETFLRQKRDINSKMWHTALQDTGEIDCTKCLP
jgi:thiol-disulfide isomerase/thioredoxin/uncharacterized membrane protein YphA (DoxX/SURF4 family)